MMRIRIRARVALLLALALVAGLISTVASPAQEANALSGKDFKAGFIISDALFYDANAMTQAQIQSFLDGKIGTCSNSLCLNVYRTATSSKPADHMCSAYAGASSETAAAVIYKVQRACGISAKVILVTLQKEQGLVTSRGPSSGALKIAMGYGCPDTAACDSTYFGLFNQVYQAARQLKRYGLDAPDNVSFHYYPVGAASYIKYTPNPNPPARCKPSLVYISNKATAALYYYTPYQPDPTALANLTGTGDPECSSYGNRNFWVYYNTWFGSSIGGGGDKAINDRYAALGGASGALGARVTTAQCGSAATCIVKYEHGSIYWSAATGAYSIQPDIAADYTRLGGPGGGLGWPTTEQAAQAGGANGDGIAQSFEYGSIYVNAAGGHSVLLPVRDAYWAVSSTRGSLGWPVTDTAAQRGGANGDGLAQSFVGGSIYAGPPGPYIVSGTIRDAFWQAGSTSGSLGWPIVNAAAQDGGPHGDGTAQSFQNGTIYAGPAGTFPVIAGFRTAYWAAQSTTGDFGWPTGAQRCTSSTSCSQSFQGGMIAQVGNAVATVTGPIYTAYSRVGGSAGALGLPIVSAASQAGGSHGNGTAQSFQGGSIYAGPPGAFAVSGAIRTAYWARTSTSGSLGWPTADAVCGSRGCTQTFQGGTLVAPVSGAAFSVGGVIGTTYAQLGGPSGALGLPTVDAAPQAGGSHGDGSAQSFQGGSIYAGPSGAFAVSGTIRAKYWAAQSTKGVLGWPTAAAVCGFAGGGCSQTFQGGLIFAPPTGAAYLSNADVLATYARAGGPSGALGLPIVDAAVQAGGSHGNGTAQSFQRGSIYAGPSGAFAVSGAIRTKYWAQQSTTGSLGWPTAAAVCTSSGCRQTFQGGTLSG
jgi:uncharacterized protein with LGFP repeats